MKKEDKKVVIETLTEQVNSYKHLYVSDISGLDAVDTQEDQLESLISIKSKEELIADIIAMLQAPMQNVISALQSGQNTIAGVVKTLSEKE